VKFEPTNLDLPMSSRIIQCTLWSKCWKSQVITINACRCVCMTLLNGFDVRGLVDLAHLDSNLVALGCVLESDWRLGRRLDRERLELR